MKKKGMRILALALAAAMLSGCGKQAKDSKSEEVSTETEGKSEGKTESNGGLDESKERVVGDSSKWDGYFVDDYGIKVRPGMTINEIVEQGCVVAPDYVDDINDFINAPAEMCVTPDYNSSSNQVLYIYVEQEDGSYSRSDFSEDAWFINPYPYAVPFGECIVSYMLPGLDHMGVEWNTDDKDSMSPEEMKALFDIEPYIDEYDNFIYPYEDYYVEFSLYEGRILMCETGTYGHDDNYPVPDCISFAGEDFKDWESESETLSPDEDSYSFMMGLGTQTIDLTYFDSIEEISRHYLPESGYTSSFHVKGTNKDGDHVTIDLMDEGVGLYYKDIAHLTYGSIIDSEELPSGEIHSAQSCDEAQNIDKFANNTLKLEVIVSTDGISEVNHTMEVYHQVEGIITTTAE